MAIHEHDCDACVYLGEFKGEDLYFHPGKHWTLISRYGPHGEYCSGSHVTKYPQMVEARRLAVERGFITADQEN